MEAKVWKGHLDPMLLSILEVGPSHGYAIIEELRRRSDGEFDLPEGSVYPALHRLERRHLIASSRIMAGGRERRVYRLTGLGLRSVAEGRSEWRRFSTAVNSVLGTGA